MDYGNRDIFLKSFLSRPNPSFMYQLPDFEGEGATAPLGNRSGHLQGSGKPEVSGYKEYDKKYSHDDEPKGYTNLRPLFAGDLKFAGRDDIGDISRDEYSSRYKESHERRGNLLRGECRADLCRGKSCVVQVLPKQYSPSRVLPGEY